mgnify:CR=1 FL=1
MKVLLKNGESHLSHITSTNVTKKTEMETIEEVNVPISFVAKLLKIMPGTLREGIRNGTFSEIGTAYCVNERYSYYISSNRLYRKFGIVYKETM